jgi:hypothetical protein
MLSVLGLRKSESIRMPIADHLAIAQQLEHHHRAITRRNKPIASESPESSRCSGVGSRLGEGI